MILQIKQIVSYMQNEDSFICQLYDQQKIRVYYEKTNFENVESNSCKQQIWNGFWRHIQNRYFLQIRNEHKQILNIIQQNIRQNERLDRIEEQNEFVQEIIDRQMQELFRQEYKNKNEIRLNNLKKVIKSRLKLDNHQTQQQQQYKQITNFLQKQINHLKNTIHPKNQIQFIIQNHLFKASIRTFCQYQIIALEKLLIKQSIKNITYYHTDLYQVLLEKCFIKSQFFIRQNQLLQLLGPSLFVKKMSNYQFINLNQGQMCHHCQNIKLHSQLKICQIAYNKFAKFKPNIIINPYYYIETYKDIHLKVTSNHYRFPFFKYKKQKGLYLCDRYYCISCIETHYQKLSDEKFVCPYCLGCCECSRCYTLDRLVKLKMLFILNNGNLQQVQKKSTIYKIFKQGSFSKWESDKSIKEYNNNSILYRCNIQISDYKGIKKEDGESIRKYVMKEC